MLCPLTLNLLAHKSSMSDMHKRRKAQPKGYRNTRTRSELRHPLSAKTRQSTTPDSQTECSPQPAREPLVPHDTSTEFACHATVLRLPMWYAAMKGRADQATRRGTKLESGLASSEGRSSNPHVLEVRWQMTGVRKRKDSRPIMTIRRHDGSPTGCYLKHPKRTPLTRRDKHAPALAAFARRSHAECCALTCDAAPARIGTTTAPETAIAVWRPHITLGRFDTWASRDSTPLLCSHLLQTPVPILRQPSPTMRTHSN